MSHSEKSSILSVQKRDARSRIELEFELTKALARVLSACANVRTLLDLQKSLRIEGNSLSRFVRFLEANGFLERSQFAGNDVLKQTEKGARLLEAFVTMYRAAADGLVVDKNRNSFRTYEPCNNCATHILFPDIPPMTIHIGGECQLCHNSVTR